MEYLPIFLKLNNKKCLVVGGGVVAYRKSLNLLKAGGDLTIVAQAYNVDFSQLKQKYENIKFMTTEVNEALLIQFSLIIAATDDSELNQLVSDIAHQHDIPVNVVDDPEKCSFIQPAIVNRSPLLVAISSSGQAPVLARRIRQQIESFLPAKLGMVATSAGKLRAKIKKLKPKNPRHLWENIFDSSYGHHVMSGNKIKADQVINDLITSNLNDKGMVYLTGAGPGDPELLTIKALNVLQRADVILYDQLVNSEILDMARRDATFIPVGKSAGKSSTPQIRINELMVEYANKGQIVCRLKGGDPFVFGRGGEEMEYLKDHDINYVIIPGITAAIGCAASAGIPLTHRGVSHSITVVTAKLKSNQESNLIPLAGNNQTLAIYMGINSADNIQEQLLKAGYATDLPVAIIEHGTTIKQRIITGALNELGCLVDRYQIMSPAIMYVGQVASFAAESSRNELHEQKNLLNVEELNAQANIHHLSA